jgi:general secretion pathway protein H
MVVVMLIGILATFAVLTLGDGGRRERLNELANTVRLLTSLAAQESVLTGRPIALMFFQDQYFLQEYRDAVWQTRENDPLFRIRALPPGIEARIGVSKSEAIDAPSQPATFLPDGGEERLLIEFRDEHTATRITLVPESDDYIVHSQ